MVSFIDTRSVSDLSINVNIDTSGFLADVDLMLDQVKTRIKSIYSKSFGRDPGLGWSWTVDVDVSKLATSLKKVKLEIHSSLNDLMVRIVNFAKSRMFFYLDKSASSDVAIIEENVNIVIPKLTRKYVKEKLRLGQRVTFLEFSGVTRSALASAPVTIRTLPNGLTISWTFTSQKFTWFNLGRGEGILQQPRPIMSAFKGMILNKINQVLKKINSTPLDEFSQIPVILRGF